MAGPETPERRYRPSIRQVHVRGERQIRRGSARSLHRRLRHRSDMRRREIVLGVRLSAKKVFHPQAWRVRSAGPKPWRRVCQEVADHPQAQKGMRVPAGDIEALVLDRLRALLSSRTDVSETLAPLDLDAYALDAALRKALNLSERWLAMPPVELQSLVQ